MSENNQGNLNGDRQEINEALEVRRGDIILAEYFFDGTWRTKPVLVIQNDIGNMFSPLVIVLPIVSSEGGDCGPMQVELQEQTQPETGLKNSAILLNVILTVEKHQLMEKIGRLPEFLLRDVENGIRISLGFSGK
ncbi:MAG TPA: type II toxin-antitoxin system PemK/MazF family toxin [Bacillota bacterium]|nr:type II toxin-antitoxin system PemK/MazF family toxin [Bacillota bacterium]